VTLKKRNKVDRCDEHNFRGEPSQLERINSIYL
jgi:hypothetical protein